VGRVGLVGVVGVVGTVGAVGVDFRLEVFFLVAITVSICNQFIRVEQ
jgi:hypothetical protein